MSLFFVLRLCKWCFVCLRFIASPCDTWVCSLWLSMRVHKQVCHLPYLSNLGSQTVRPKKDLFGRWKQCQLGMEYLRWQSSSRFSCLAEGHPLPCMFVKKSNRNAGAPLSTSSIELGREPRGGELECDNNLSHKPCVALDGHLQVRLFFFFFFLTWKNDLFNWKL
jgi:hypothetical protein